MADDGIVAGRYEVIQTISTGDRGSLRKARDRDLDRFVALKTLVLRDEDALDDLRSETKILHDLQHPNLPTVRHDFVLPDGSYVMVIDWVDGTDLEEKLVASGRPGLVLPSVVDWIGQVADAIDYLHSQDPPIVHGDVKPSNIVLARTNRAVLLDFGIARRVGQLSNAGTRGFMAPEVGMGEPVSPATDVYGLAATTYTLLTGRAPGVGHFEIPDIDEAHAAALEQVLDHALATDPARRISSAGQYAERLRRAKESFRPGSTITLLATEIVDYDGLWDRDAALMDELAPRVESIVRIAVDDADGRVAIDSGGEHMLSGFPGASGALRSALEIRGQVFADAWLRELGVRLRVALHTGEPEHRYGQFRGAPVNRIQRLCRSAEPGQILVSGVTAGLLMDRLPPGTRLVEVALPLSAGSSTLAGPVHSLETDEMPPLIQGPPPVPMSGPTVPPPAVAPPLRRAASKRLLALLGEHDELDELANLKLQQEAEAQRAGQPRLADRFGHEAAELTKRRLEVQREVERLEVEGDGGSAG